ncbi:MAG: peptidylprolyl isomerase, partial [Candidatus Doudnabacteria bacterium]|nr:peptidylprolyl isomerase [Candidatus Doudnabacteria bacterium]
MENVQNQPQGIGEPSESLKNQTDEKQAVAAACERKFDAEKLKTAKLLIKNRGVEINVKGFGNITVEFFDKDAPKTVENFLRLANAGYFDCLTFHRVAKGFVIQGGDPTGTGSGGDSAFGGEFADEINPTSELYKMGYKKGVLAMANRGPNTNTSQFFILLADA